MRLSLLLLFFCAFNFLHAQEPSLYFEKIAVQDGLSHNKVNCIIQDKRGFMWLGTDDGLNRYDGKNFLHFRKRYNDSTGISGNLITDLFEDAEGIVWIATADGGLSKYDYRLPAQQQFKQYRHIPADPTSIPVNTINTLVEDNRGFLWLGTSGHSVLRFNKKTGRFESIAKNNRTVLDMCLDKNGMIWVGRQGGGILKINPSNLSYVEDERYHDLYAKLPHVTVTALFNDRDSHIWFGSWDRVLYKQNGLTGKEEVFQSETPYSFQNDEILSFAEDKSGKLWMGGKNRGLHIYDKVNNRFYNYPYDPSKEGSVADNRINCIFIDNQGRVWLGTNRGVCINNPKKQQFVQTFLTSGPQTELTVYDFYEDEQGNIWMGTSDGIFIVNKENKITRREIKYKGKNLAVTNFFRDEAGIFYLGTNYSLFKYQPLKNIISLLPNTEKDGVMNQIIDSRVVSVVKDEIEGRPVLIAAPYGHFLAYYDFQRKQWVSRLDSMNIISKFNLKDNLIRKLYRAKNGVLWLATAKQGLGLWRPGSIPKVDYFNHDPEDPTSLSNNNVFDITEDREGNLWIGTFGGGLNYFNTRSKKFTHITASSNLIEGVQPDRYGNVWMISNGHLNKYDPVRKSYTSYELPDLEKTGGVRGKIFMDSEGKLYVAGPGYFISFDPGTINESKWTPKVHFTGFQVFNKSFSHLLQKEKIRLNYNDNYFTMEFAAPYYSSESRIHYSYMLENFHDDWIEAGERNYVSFSNLDGGDYVFKVRATNTPGVWPPEYASIKITIIPPFWKQLWFYLLCAFVLSFTIYFIYRYRINELLKRQAIRNKIAQDLHDNVGSTLSSISVYSQVAKIYHNQQKQTELYAALEKISDTSSEMISELNDTVWAINPRNDNMNVILQRMESLARPLLAARDIHFHFHYDDGLKHLNLGMTKRRNFYSVFKESINNCIKYSECKNIWVDVSQRSHRISMTIKDDGKGFELSKTSEGYKSSDVFGGGNGLKNMQLRAKEMKGVLRITSEPGKGTTIELNFPVTGFGDRLTS